MADVINKLIEGHRQFHQKYLSADPSIMQKLGEHGQSPEVMVVACCDSRVDPAVVLQCDPGDLFVARNVANIIPPYELDSTCHSTSAALEVGIQVLNIKHLIIMGHSGCAGIKALLDHFNEPQNDFINAWMEAANPEKVRGMEVNDCVRATLHSSYENCLTFPWIKEKVEQQQLEIHRWFFEIKTGQIYAYSAAHDSFKPLVDLSNEE